MCSFQLQLQNFSVPRKRYLQKKQNIQTFLLQAKNTIMFLFRVLWPLKESIFVIFRILPVAICLCLQLFTECTHTVDYNNKLKHVCKSKDAMRRWIVQIITCTLKTTVLKVQCTERHTYIIHTKICYVICMLIVNKKHNFQNNQNFHLFPVLQCLKNPK
jgi:hypothetical protein